MTQSGYNVSALLYAFIIVVMISSCGLDKAHGVILFEFRSMLDIMDGAIYRAQAHSK